MLYSNTGYPNSNETNLSLCHVTPNTKLYSKFLSTSSALNTDLHILLICMSNKFRLEERRGEAGKNETAEGSDGLGIAGGRILISARLNVGLDSTNGDGRRHGVKSGFEA